MYNYIYFTHIDLVQDENHTQRQPVFDSGHQTTPI